MHNTAGIKVDYKAKIANIEPGEANIRCINLCWTGDHPAQCEVGNFISSGGVHACRRDHLQGKSPSNLLLIIILLKSLP